VKNNKHFQIKTIDGQMAVDLFLPPTPGPHPVLVYCHGFKGFKQWGHVPYIHEYFATGEYAVITFNHSHNGVVGDGDTFDALDLFAINTVSKEQNDLESLGKWIRENGKDLDLNVERISWLGHSRGGANVIVFAARCQDYVEKVIAWSPIPSYQFLFESYNKSAWKEKRTVFTPNARTQQQMPLDYSIWENLLAHEEEFDVLEAARSIGRPLLIVHGEADPIVPAALSEPLYEACLHSLRMTVPKADHTYGMSHPCNGMEDFSKELWVALDNTLSFLEEI
jgi:pimeloyl-ACP methyl ester carboxylesterase